MYYFVMAINHSKWFSIAQANHLRFVAMTIRKFLLVGIYFRLSGSIANAINTIEVENKGFTAHSV